MADVVYVEHPAAFRRAFQTWPGDVGQYLTRRTERVRTLAMLLAPGPGKSPRNRSGVNWSTGQMQARISTEYGHVTTGDLESTVTSNARYTMFVHAGTKPHVILPHKPGGWLRFQGRTGETVYAQKVNHPGNAGYPFLSMALEAGMK